MHKITGPASFTTIKSFHYFKTSKMGKLLIVHVGNGGQMLVLGSWLVGRTIRISFRASCMLIENDSGQHGVSRIGSVWAKMEETSEDCTTKGTKIDVCKWSYKIIVMLSFLNVMFVSQDMQNNSNVKFTCTSGNAGLLYKALKTHHF